MKEKLETLPFIDIPTHFSIFGCADCVCKTCLMWWSSRCPHGECYDEYRAKVIPYDKAHPNEPPRTTWSNWKTDQAYWCRGFQKPHRKNLHRSRMPCLEFG